jgi:hypothetical protein
MLTFSSCRCKHEFCYLCAARWKTCSCQNADEENVVNNGGGDNNDNNDDDSDSDDSDDGYDGYENVEPPRENAEPPHEHDYEQTYHGDTTCDECDHLLPWIMHCEDCGSRLCRRCLD